MRYMGGKKTASKYFAPIVQSARETPDQVIWDAFCGGLHCALAFGGPVACSDNNEALITLYKAVAAGWDPPETMTKEEWEFCRDHLGPDDPHRAFAGFGCSWMGCWFIRYQTTIKDGVDVSAGFAAGQCRRGLIRDVPALVKRGCTFEHRDFFDIKPMDWVDGKTAWLGDRPILYLDPPYAKQRDYSKGRDPAQKGAKTTGGFDHDAFWQRCLEWAGVGVPVFVSEYACPLLESQAQKVWTMETPFGFTAKGKAKAKQKECLFYVSGRTVEEAT